MLPSDKLREIAVKQQTTQLNVRREYVQHLLLSYFYRQPQFGNIYFKGGTALRLIYNSPRFSEDLDFSTPRSDITTIEDGIQNTLTEAEREGIRTEIMESKPTTYGYLASIDVHLAQETITIQIEISFRDTDAKGEVVTIASDFIPPYTIMALSEVQLVKQKIRALLTRRKPRDFYDIYFILRKEHMFPPQEKVVVPQILKALEESHISFDKELTQFLPKSHWKVIKDFQSILKREIQKFI